MQPELAGQVHREHQDKVLEKKDQGQDQHVEGGDSGDSSSSSVSFDLDVAGDKREERLPVLFLMAEPKTGRTHQIRLHCASLGLSILGKRILYDLIIMHRP